MLDWSYSPLVALHFATADLSDFERDGVVWCVNYIESNKLLPNSLKGILDKGYVVFVVRVAIGIGVILLAVLALGVAVLLAKRVRRSRRRSTSSPSASPTRTPPRSAPCCR